MQLIEIFKAGKRQSANGQVFHISRDDLQKVVDNYNAEFHEAPMVVGHPKMDAPAYGWIERLELDGDVLKAQPKDVDAEFAELVRRGKFKKISAAFYLPNANSNPKPDGYYLRHVGFLGAMPPAVKGLKDPIFNDSEKDVVEFSEFSDWANAGLWARLRDFFIEKFGLEETDKVLPAWQVQDLHEQAIRDEMKTENQPEFAPHFSEETESNTAEPTDNHTTDLITSDTQPQGETMSLEDQQKLAELEAENAKLRATQAEMAKAATEKDNAEFAESLLNAGKLIPRQKEAALALLNTDFDSVEFAESDFKQHLKAFLSELPKAVEFAEQATKENVATAPDETVEYAEGTSPESIQADQAIRTYMKEHNVGYAVAFNAIYQ
ncbi:peptidase [Lonepinella koalarum]|uniref:peptidase n=1 Tax=Lonepinella koalarum TaxID=53417 RepID=UPI003F6E1583